MATVYAETFFKESGEKLDYAVDWTAWLETGDTVAASVWAVPTGITEVSAAFDTHRATIILSGGTAGVHYEVVNTITTATGLVAIRTLDIRIVQNS
jgi:hypothetical protein